MADRVAAHESGFVTSIAFTEEQVCGLQFLRDFAAACREMSPLVEGVPVDAFARSRRWRWSPLHRNVHIDQWTDGCCWFHCF